MKLKFAAAVLAVTALSATSALAAAPYIGVSGGITLVHDSDVEVTGVGNGKFSYNAGGGINVCAGVKHENLRVEAEYGYKDADIDKASSGGVSVTVPDSNITITSYMLNAYYDFKTDRNITPYLGVGAGAVHGKINTPGETDKDTQFGYQLTAGISVPVNPSVNLDLAYRYQGTTGDFSNNGVSISYGSSSFIAGVRVSF